MGKLRKKTTVLPKPLKVEEPVIPYLPVKQPLFIADFPYKKFKKIAELVPFTQSEWSEMLHLSERTLQRYAKNNSSFEGIYTDRILLLQQMIHLGVETFQNEIAFYQWLKKEKKILGHTINFQSLFTDRGIQEIIDQLTRIQYGVYT